MLTQPGDIDSREYAQEKITAIHKSYEIGELLAVEHPEITKMYREGSLQDDIAKSLIPDEVAKSRLVARSAVGIALRKLIPQDEMKKLVRQRKIETATKVGNKTYKNKIGIFALGEEETRKNKQKGGQTIRDNKVGIHGLSEETRGRISRQALIARGFVPFSDEEIKRLVELATDPQYIRESHIAKSRKAPDYETIASIMNDEFGISRTADSLEQKINYLKRKKY